MAKELGQTSLMFLVHPTLSETEMNDTCYAVTKVLSAAASTTQRVYGSVSKLVESATGADD